jgi:copper resistance protein B
MARVGICASGFCFTLLAASTAYAQAQPQAYPSNTAPPAAPITAPDHVPPDPPQEVMGDMAYKDMVSMMQMDDARLFGKVMIDQLEWRDAQEGSAGAWDAEGWYGGDYNKLWVKTEGEVPPTGAERPPGMAGRVAAPGTVQQVGPEASLDVLFDRVIGRWWDAQGGIRQDFGQGPARTWLAMGLQGIAPYWLDAEATLYVGEEGRTAARLKADYDLLFTQRLILQPYGEANFYSRSDPRRQVGSGLSDLELSLRLRYEVRREFAPYLGVGWFRRFGATAELARAAGEGSDEVQLVAGLHVWF